VENSSSKIHEKHPLLGTHSSCHDGEALLCHLNQISFLLLGVTASDDQTKEKFDNIVCKLDRSGDKLKQDKPTDNAKLQRNCFLILHYLQFFALDSATNNVANTNNMPASHNKLDCQFTKKHKVKFDVERINAIFKGEYPFFHNNRLPMIAFIKIFYTTHHSFFTQDFTIHAQFVYLRN